MNNTLQDITFEALENQRVNGYPHDWEMSTEQYLDEMIEHGVFEDDLDEEEREAVTDAILYWRVSDK